MPRRVIWPKRRRIWRPVWRSTCRSTRRRIPTGADAHATLLRYWTESGQSDKAERLAGGDGSDLIPIVERIEAEHRAWVAEDPDNRHFGPPSPVTGATE